MDLERVAREFRVIAPVRAISASNRGNFITFICTFV